MIQASNRSKGISYAIREVVVPAQLLEKKGFKILHLNIGDPNKYDFDTPKHMKSALYKATLEGYNGYSLSEGDLNLRDAIINREKIRNSVDYDLNNICITSGVTESLQILLNALLNPNDELLVPGPTYPQYTLITLFNGAIPIAYNCLEGDNWQPDVEDIRKKLSNKSKAIVIINPNNPTGALYSKKVIKNIIDLAGEYNIPIISDEIYDDITFDNKQYATASLTNDVPIITFNGFSKLYLVPGWRIGYVLFHHLEELNEVQDAFMRIARSRLCANSVCQRACIEALNGPQNHIKEVNKKLKKRRDYSYKRLNEINGLSSAKPDGAFYIFPKIDAIESGPWKDDKDFVLDLLHHAQVLVVHGSGFCSKFGKDHFRGVILPPLDILEQAFNKIESFMNLRLK
ncbi:MAG: aminotransferase class I/II-fold pyridoxal phosphate-dependent enzyme [Candidatus Thermoplasmatota archaeon]|jgi:aspartate/methionine/tyrosine aminotransferase|nr:aminotransferase class I/II-fold pyridoxal phosphate-dependent enzyme [Thermoplasmatales archaeon]